VLDFQKSRFIARKFIKNKNRLSREEVQCQMLDRPCRCNARTYAEFRLHGGQALVASRQLSHLFLREFDEAFTIWGKAASVDSNPLDGKYWHLQEEEEDVIRKALQGANATGTKCGQLFALLPRIRTTQMRGATEWTPGNDPYHRSIRSLVIPSSMSGYDIYRTRLIWRRNWRIVDEIHIYPHNVYHRAR